MNTKVFDHEPSALFEKDEEFASTYEDLMKFCHKMETELPFAQLMTLWDKVVQSEKTIADKIVLLPSQKDLQDSIERENYAQQKAESELKAVKDRHSDLLFELKKKQNGLLSLLDPKRKLLPCNQEESSQKQKLSRTMKEYVAGLVQLRKSKSAQSFRMRAELGS